MEGGGLFNSGILGTDFIWWIGQIADDSTWRDNIIPSKFPSAQSIPGWGARYKVRIMGVHDQGQIIAEEDLPWANIIYPVTAGGGQTNSWMSSNLRQGNIVFGFYMDGKDMQNPVILGVMGNNAQTALGFKIGKDDDSVTNTQPGQIAKSGFAVGEDPPEGTAKPRVSDDALTIEKPKSEEVAKESAPLAPGATTNQYGLNYANPITPTQQQDIQSAKSQAQSQGLSGEQEKVYVQSKVKQGVANRAGAANSPTSEPQPGPTIEQVGSAHLQSSADVKKEDKYQEKTVVMNPDDPVGSATKAIQTEVDNLTAKIDKFMGSRKQYVDAVSGPPTKEEINKDIRDTACKISKFQKIIMDKISEYQSKKLNNELTAVVAAMPSSARAMMGDQKFLNTENNLKEYNEITNGMCDQMEGILREKLDIEKLMKQADAEASSGLLFGDAASQGAVGGMIDLSDFGVDPGDDGSGSPLAGDSNIRGSGSAYKPPKTRSDVSDPRTPSVPLCYAEDVVAQAIAVNKDRISQIAESQHTNFNKFLGGLKSELEQADKELAESSADKTDLGQVTGFTDEEEDDLPQGGTNYYTENGVPTTGGNGTGFMVDITVPNGGLYDNGFITINSGGAGYTVNVANSGSTSGTGTTEGAATTGGSGTGILVNYTISSGVITGITTNTGGANYKSGDVLTVTNNAAGTPSTNATFTVEKVRGKVNTVKNKGIIVANPGSGYQMGDLIVVNQEGSGLNCGIVITQVKDPGTKKATAGPVTPADTQGSNATSPQPPAGQKLGDMLEMLGGMSGSMTQALDFKNVLANMFPFENPPNVAVSDFYTLARGGAGQPETELPSGASIDKAVSEVKEIAPPVESVPFIGPTPNSPNINLASTKLGGLASQADAALGIDRGSTQEEVNKAIKKAKAKAGLDYKSAFEE